MQRIPIVLVFLLVLSFSACGRKDAGPDIYPKRINSPHDFKVMLSLMIQSGEDVHRDQLSPKTSLVVRLLSIACKDKSEPVHGRDISRALDVIAKNKKAASAAPIVRAHEKKPVKPVDYWIDARANLDLKPIGVSKLPDGKYTAMLSDFLKVKTGDILSTAYKGRVYRWTVISVSNDGYIRLRELDVK